MNRCYWIYSMIFGRAGQRNGFRAVFYYMENDFNGKYSMNWYIFDIFKLLVLFVSFSTRENCFVYVFFSKILPQTSDLNFIFVVLLLDEIISENCILLINSLRFLVITKTYCFSSSYPKFNHKLSFNLLQANTNGLHFSGKVRIVFINLSLRHFVPLIIHIFCLYMWLTWNYLRILFVETELRFGHIDSFIMIEYVLPYCIVCCCYVLTESVSDRHVYWVVEFSCTNDKSQSCWGLIRNLLFYFWQAHKAWRVVDLHNA